MAEKTLDILPAIHILAPSVASYDITILFASRCYCFPPKNPQRCLILLLIVGTGFSFARLDLSAPHRFLEQSI